VLVSDDVFRNHQTGDKAASVDLQDAFGTTVMRDCALQILEKGEIQLTTAERKELTEQKRREIVSYIHKYYLDPKTKLPHPITRVELALDQMKFHAVYDQDTHTQIEAIMKKMPEFMPVKKMEIEGVLIVAHKFAGQVAGVVPKFATIGKEDYSDAGIQYTLSVVPGDFDPFMAELNRITKGDFQFNVDGAAFANAPVASSSSSGDAKGKGKKGKGK